MKYFLHLARRTGERHFFRSNKSWPVLPPVRRSPIRTPRQVEIESVHRELGVCTAAPGKLLRKTLQQTHTLLISRSVRPTAEREGARHR